MGTQTHQPKNLVSPRISAIYFENVGNCIILKRVKKKTTEIGILISGGTSPADFATEGRIPAPAFDAHACDIWKPFCKKSPGAPELL